MFLFVSSFEHFYFGVIIDSQEVANIVHRGSMEPLHPVSLDVISFMIIAHYQNQVFDTGVKLYIVLCHLNTGSSCNHHRKQNSSIPSKIFSLLPLYSHMPLSPLPHLELQTIINLFSISIVLSFQECYINRIMEYITFYDWHFSLSLISSRSIQVFLYQ